MKSIRPETSTYHFYEKLGEGISGCVYRAIREDAAGLCQVPVAVKILKSDNLVSAWKSEIEKLHKIRSKNCVCIYSWEKFPQGSGMVLEYVKGVTLQHLISNSQFNCIEIQEILFQIQEGLKDLKNANCFHGDLHPGNVMVDVLGNVKLLDFGIIELGPNLVQGNPKYLSPERWQGANCSIQADLYALGIIERKLEGNEDVPLKIEDEIGWLSREAANRDWDDELEENLFARNLLAQKVNRLVEDGGYQIVSATQVFTVVNVIKVKTVNRWIKKAMMIAGVLSTCLLNYRSEAESMGKVSFSQLEVRTSKWVEVELDGVKLGYSPFKMQKLPSGLHQLRWKSAASEGAFGVELKPNELTTLGDLQFQTR